PRDRARWTSDGRLRYRPAALPPGLTDQAIRCPSSRRLARRHTRPHAAEPAIREDLRALGAAPNLVRSRPMPRPLTPGLRPLRERRLLPRSYHSRSVVCAWL